MKKSLLVLFVSIAMTMVLASCFLAKNSPVAPGPALGGIHLVEATAVPTPAYSGAIEANKVANTVTTVADSAKLILSTTRQLVATTGQIKLFLLDTTPANAPTSVAIVEDYSTITKTYSQIVIKPAAALIANRRYVFVINPSAMSDIDGNQLDFDGDKVQGEIPDDVELYYFTTRRSVITEVVYPNVNYDDRTGPALSSTPFCWLSGAQQLISNNSTNWPVDVGVLYQRVTDNVLTANRLSQTTVALSTGSAITGSVVWLRKFENKEQVPATVSFGADPADADPLVLPKASTIKIAIASALVPFTKYELVMKKNLIADAVGNKMDNDNSKSGGLAVLVAFTTGDTTLDPSVASTADSIIKGDRIGPTVTYSPITKALDFSEAINTATITNQSVYVKDASGNLLPCAFDFVTIINPDNSTFPRVIVRTVKSAAVRIYVRLDLIKDLSPNANTGVAVNFAY